MKNILNLSKLTEGLIINKNPNNTYEFTKNNSKFNVTITQNFVEITGKNLPKTNMPLATFRANINDIPKFIDKQISDTFDNNPILIKKIEEVKKSVDIKQDKTEIKINLLDTNNITVTRIKGYTILETTDQRLVLKTYNDFKYFQKILVNNNTLKDVINRTKTKYEEKSKYMKNIFLKDDILKEFTDHPELDKQFFIILNKYMRDYSGYSRIIEENKKIRLCCRSKNGAVTNTLDIYITKQSPDTYSVYLDGEDDNVGAEYLNPITNKRNKLEKGKNLSLTKQTNFTYYDLMRFLKSLNVYGA